VATGAGALAGQVRRGLRELEVLASFVVHRRRQTGQPVTREAVAAATLSAYLGQPAPNIRGAVPGLVWQWTKRSVRTESERSLHRRADRIVAALQSI
jgi:hypothetical protein